MQYTDERFHLRVELNAKECNIPTDELTRMQHLLAPVGEAVQDWPSADLNVKVIRHPRSEAFTVKCKLRLPGQTLSTADEDPYMDSAFQRCVRKLVRRVEEYRAHPERRVAQVAGREAALDRDIVAPQDADAGPVGAAYRAGDYRAFRTALAGYEEWLRKRVGRWVQRYPEAQAQIGDGLLLGDLLEEVYLNAFEHYGQRPDEVPLHDWFDRLIDPSLKALLRNPDEERQNASFARTVREGRLGAT
jgi:ribosome-associated translation inhibitor RaiA